MAEHTVVDCLGLALLLGTKLDVPKERGGGERPTLEPHNGGETAAAAEAQVRARQESEGGRCHH